MSDRSEKSGHMWLQNTGIVVAICLGLWGAFSPNEDLLLKRKMAVIQEGIRHDQRDFQDAVTAFEKTKTGILENVAGLDRIDLELLAAADSLSTHVLQKGEGTLTRDSLIELIAVDVDSKDREGFRIGLRGLVADAIVCGELRELMVDNKEKLFLGSGMNSFQLRRAVHPSVKRAYDFAYILVSKNQMRFTMDELIEEVHNKFFSDEEWEKHKYSVEALFRASANTGQAFSYKNGKVALGKRYLLIFVDDQNGRQ